MGSINVRKRGKVYEYFFEGAKVNNKRTRISKSGFKTKNEAYECGFRAYVEYKNGGVKKESQICNITPYMLNQALLKLYQKSQTKDSLRNYQKVIRAH